MSWFNDPNCEAASLLEHVEIAYAVDFAFSSGHIRLSTWSGDIVIGGNTYAGIGSIAGIDAKADTTDLVAQQRTYSMTGVDPAVIPESEIDNSYRCDVVEYEVWINPDTKAVIGTELNFEGYISKIRRVDGKEPVISILCENRFATLERADGWRYTPEHQAKFFAGDTGLDQVRGIESREVIWNGSRVTTGGKPGIPLRGQG